MIAKVTRQALSLITTPHHLILTLVVGGTRSLYLNLSRSTYLLFGNTRSLQKCICSIVEHRSKKLFSVGSSSSPPPPHLSVPVALTPISAQAHGYVQNLSGNHAEETSQPAWVQLPTLFRCFSRKGLVWTPKPDPSRGTVPVAKARRAT